MKFKSILSSTLAVLTLSLGCMLPSQAAGTWETSLLGRDINLNAVAATDASAVYLYDTTLDVTWLRDANLNGQMNWNTAKAWAANLETGNGATTISDWRLPTLTGVGWGYADSEMGSLFVNTLGNTPGAAWTNTGSFNNMQLGHYWFDALTPMQGVPWSFYTHVSRHDYFGSGALFYAMAVRPGDVAAVPEPENYAMLLAGLGMIITITHRRSKIKSGALTCHL